ncbi:MAG TPA: LamG domain-containing protein, partial [Flavisolibacter sp.]|nr:LamG domain-containing protein [Flavisolibacter sp.]
LLFCENQILPLNMRNIIYTLSGILLITLLLSTQIGVTSCTKETVVHDTTKVQIHDTIWKSDVIRQHINDSLWAYYPINGSTADSSGHNHTLVLNNGASLSYDKHGNEQSALNFNGNENYASIADGALFPTTGAFSVSLVVMPRVNKGLFFGKQDYNTAKGSSFNVGIDNVINGDVTRFSITSNASQICDQIPLNGYLLSNPNAFNPFAWYHIVITFKSGVMKLYVNGSLVNSRTIDVQTILGCPNSQFILANWWSGDHNGFDGKMNDIRIYTRTLSDIEAKYLFDKCSINL